MVLVNPKRLFLFNEVASIEIGFNHIHTKIPSWLSLTFLVLHQPSHHMHLPYVNHHRNMIKNMINFSFNRHPSLGIFSATNHQQCRVATKFSFFWFCATYPVAGPGPRCMSRAMIIHIWLCQYVIIYVYVNIIYINMKQYIYTYIDPLTLHVYIYIRL